jgi:hypothetical protein
MGGGCDGMGVFCFNDMCTSFDDLECGTEGLDCCEDPPFGDGCFMGTDCVDGTCEPD